MKSKAIITAVIGCVLALGLASCKTTGEGRHTMGSKTNNWPMNNADMPGYR